MSEWNFDMDAAPRDGTKVDLLFPYPRGRTIDCVWDDNAPIGGMWIWRTPCWIDGSLLQEAEWKIHCYPNMRPYAWALAPALPEPPSPSTRKASE